MMIKIVSLSIPGDVTLMFDVKIRVKGMRETEI